MNALFRKSVLPLILLALTGCASQGKLPPSISLDEPVQAQPLPEPPAPVEVVAVPEPLALQLMQLTLIVVAVSILVHGLSVKPLMNQLWRRGRV